MKINVANNVKNLNVTVNKSEDGFEILITEKEDNEENKTLGSVAPGNIVNIGKRKYIVLGHEAETTALLDANNVSERVFDCGCGDYETSSVRKYINDKYYKELCVAVGEGNVIKHKVNLEADDGTNKDAFCEDFVSLITTENYRRYREHIPAAGYRWWTATRTTTGNKYYSRGVCCVDSSGIVSWDGCGWFRGVRPFCILNSSVSVSCNQ